MVVLTELETCRPLPWLEAALQQALSGAHHSHALLVHGPSGTGSFGFALALAAAWLCEHPSADRTACGHCASCRLLAARTHPDLHLIVPEALRAEAGLPVEAQEGEEARKRKPSREIRVEQIRAALDFCTLTASRGTTKVVLIHPAEQINAIGANALLKTLEEPPAGVRFVFSCGASPESLLPTLRSRCQLQRLPLPKREVGLTWLRDQGVKEGEVVLDASGGEPLRALAMVRSGLDGAAWRALPDRLARGDASALADWPLPVLIDALQKYCHDQMLHAIGCAPRYFSADALNKGATPVRSALMALTRWAIELRELAQDADHPWHAALSCEALVSHAQGVLQEAGGSIHSRP
jgi:DNA polymerase-3 subunit delta'